MNRPPSGVTAGVDLGGTGTRIVALDHRDAVAYQLRSSIGAAVMAREGTTP
jgi:hypothetical protein